MSRDLASWAKNELDEIRDAGLEKQEKFLVGPQSAHIETVDGGRYLNMCANNYLGLANDPRLIEAAKAALDSHGFGMASVRFICGTSDLHRRLEQRLAAFLGTEDCILFPSCFDANAAVFEVLTGAGDTIISDALNHASIIDGVRLSKATRRRYGNSDMVELEQILQSSPRKGKRLIVTDGVFSMDGYLARLPEICALAEKYDATVLVDDSHAVGLMGETGAGTPEHFGVQDQVALLTGTLGKALGGASGGYIAGPAPIVELLKQRARPYLFSNSVAPSIVAAGLRVMDILAESGELRMRLREHATRFRSGLQDLGFDLLPGEHAIIPVMVGDARLAGDFAEALRQNGIYVSAFSFPVVPRRQARIRTQMSAAFTAEDIDFAIDAFEKAGRDVGLIGGA